jgi:hypothetical protein
MSEAIKASELVKKNTKLVTCKSGNIYKIRKMPLPTMAKFFGAIGIKISKDTKEMENDLQVQSSDPAKTEKLILAIREALPQCIVEPKVSLIEPSNDITVNIDDLPIDDLFELFGTITDFSGFSTAKMDENESFRQKPNR